jgi:hypothetical protein
MYLGVLLAKVGCKVSTGSTLANPKPAFRRELPAGIVGTAESRAKEAVGAVRFTSVRKELA